jgi:phosphoribosylanthranilate isomerase
MAMNQCVTAPLRLKVCGITRLEDALLASELGVDAIGFVFYKKSPRYISYEDAQHIIQQLPPFMSVVGLFVNPAQEDIDTALQTCSLDIIQLHGDESPTFCAQQTLRVIKAVPISTVEDLDNVKAFDCTVLLDAKAPEDVYGGTGNSFDWSLLGKLSHNYPLILAGGINSQNIEDAKVVKGLYALDVSSGVESSKGIKDKQKMKILCEKFR